MLDSLTTSRARPGLEPVWAVPVVLAVAASVVNGRPLAVVLPLLAVALVPWVLGIAGRVLPAWLFGALSLLPVAGISVVTGLNGGQFLATTALCQLSTRAVRPWQLGLLIALGVAVPVTVYVNGPVFDPGAIYFAIGNQFGIIIGRLLGRSRMLGERLRAADARLAAVEAQEQRARLARDVHDLVAHSLTVVLLQLGGARRVLRTSPERAEAALEQAERVGRESLDGIREVVGLLRTDDASPHGSIDLAHLVETYRTAGVPVEFDDGGSETLPLLVRGTVYRVTREALANAARYRSGDRPVRVGVRIGPADAVLEVANSGSRGHRSKPGGFGLDGLREQVAALGGSIRAGPVAGPVAGTGADEWLVTCRVPLAASSRVGPSPVVREA